MAKPFDSAAMAKTDPQTVARLLREYAQRPDKFIAFHQELTGTGGKPRAMRLSVRQ